MSAHEIERSHQVPTDFKMNDFAYIPIQAQVQVHGAAFHTALLGEHPMIYDSARENFLYAAGM